MTKPLRVQYVSAPAGSGKTYHLQILAIDLAKNSHCKVLIAQPSKILITQTAQAIKALNPNITVTTIHQTAEGTAVVPRIEKHMREADKSSGQILLITHESLKRLPDAYRKHWDLYVDEIPSVFECIPLSVVKTHKILTSHISVKDIAAGIGQVEIKDGHYNAVEDIKINKTEDELVAHYGIITNHLLHENRIVMVRTEEYEKLIDGTKEKGETNFFSILDAGFVAGYKSVTFLGANAEETELYILWTQLKCAKFVQHPTLQRRLRYQQHGNGSRLTINYLFENEWTKSRSQVCDPATGATILSRVGQFIKDYFAGQRFLWVANKSVELDLFDQNDKLPPVSHGLNMHHFMNCNAVASIIALVHNPASTKFLLSLGLSEHQIRTIICYQAEYQAIMRCSLREPSAIAPVTVIVPSRSSAEWIAARFNGCNVSKLETGIDWEPARAGRPKGTKGPRQAKTSAERQREYRQRQKAMKAKDK